LDTPGPVPSQVRPSSLSSTGTSSDGPRHPQG
jgi:hypothetical protein